MRKSIAAAAALVLLGVGGAQAQDGKLRWKMQSAFPGSLPVTGPLSRMIVEKATFRIFYEYTSSAIQRTFAEDRF